MNPSPTTPQGAGAEHTNHTPGEWFRMDRRYKDDERPTIEIVTFREDGNPDQRIATVHDCDVNPTQEHADSVIANARLIASAPDLLARNKELVEALDWIEATAVNLHCALQATAHMDPSDSRIAVETGRVVKDLLVLRDKARSLLSQPTP